MAWCATHNRIITGTYTSCSVKSEDRYECVPVSWGTFPFRELLQHVLMIPQRTATTGMTLLIALSTRVALATRA
jgi:hypothetical protein